MGAIRIDLLSLHALSQAAGAFEVHLDCWRATLRVDTDQGAWTLNGMDVGEMFVLGVAGGDSSAVPFVFGGRVLNGAPVNLNEIWRFDPVSGAKMFGFVALEYWDVSLPNPQK